jgi:hypothetical protein
MNLHSEGSIGPARSPPGGSSAFRVPHGSLDSLDDAARLLLRVRHHPLRVMAGPLVPAIHVFPSHQRSEDVDARDGARA